MPRATNKNRELRTVPVKVAVRPARAEDREFLVSLSESVFRAYAHDPTVVMLRMLKNQTGEVLVAEDATPRRAATTKKRDLRLGFAVVGIEELGRPFGPWLRPSVARLDAIAVQPQLAGRGIGRHLLLHAEDVARARGAVSMSLMTADSNAPARRLFRNAGYQVILPLEDVYIDGQHGLTMFKAL
jgi:ribosomal protein S18 acetylase RimI-like enzyme